MYGAVRWCLSYCCVVVTGVCMGRYDGVCVVVVVVTGVCMGRYDVVCRIVGVVSVVVGVVVTGLGMVRDLCLIYV